MDTHIKTMKKSVRKILSIMLCLVLSVNVFMFAAPGTKKTVQAATTNQKNIAARADYMYNSTWVCKKTISGWRGNYTFYAGETYRLPYAWPVTTGAYIGFGVSVEDFLTAAANSSSVFYTNQSYYDGASYSYSTYYGSDCSSFVSWCWGISRNTTYGIPNQSTYIGGVTVNNCTYSLQLGDALNSNDHVVLVSDLKYDSNGAITQIEITEQTPPQMKRSYYTPTELSNKYYGSYSIYRYTGTVPAAPASQVETKPLPTKLADLGSSFTAKIDYPAAGKSITIYDPNDVKLYQSTTNNAQKWNFVKQSDGSYEITNVSYGTCLDVFDGSGDSGSNVQIWADNDTSAQRWFIYDVNGKYVLRPGCSTDCVLTIEGGGSADGTNAEISYYVADSSQMFNITKVESTGTTGGNTGGTGYDRGYAGGMAGDGKIYAHGFDLSSWQEGAVNFQAIKNAGYDFVILRAGTSKGKDKCFDTFYTQAKAAGLDVGAYYYSYALNVTESNTDANNMLSWIAGKTFEYPLYFDYEDPSQESLSNTEAKNICLTFMDKLANAGYLTGMYTGKYKSTVIPTSEICARYEIWIAHYYDYTYESKSSEYCTKYGMYQYTDRKTFSSYGPYDANVVFKDYPTIVKTYGFNGYSTTMDNEEEETTPEDGALNIGDDFYARFNNVGAGLNLSIYSTDKSVITYHASTSDAQQWHFVRQSDGSYEITNVGYSMCLTAGSGSGAAVTLAADNDSKAQRWFVYESGSSYILSPANAKTYVMGVEGDSTEEEAKIIITTNGDKKSQKFNINKMMYEMDAVDLGKNFVAYVKNVNSAKRLAIDSTNVVLATSASDSKQKWHFVRQSDGSYEIKNIKSYKCLEVKDDNASAGGDIQIYKDDNSTGQRWFVYEVLDGQYVFRPACSTDCVLDISNAGTADGAEAVTSTYVGSKSQMFMLSKQKPIVSTSLEAGEVTEPTEVKYTVKGANSATYSINGAKAVSFSSSVTLTVGNNTTDTIVITAKGDAGTTTKTYTYTLKKSLNGLNQADDGKWYYYVNGVVDTTYTGMVEKEDGVWYVKNGVLIDTYTGMLVYNGKWIYATNGKYDTSYTGMAKNSYGWWYIRKGNLDRTFTGMAKNAYGWWYMKDGKLDRTYTGMAKNAYGVWYMKDGKLDRTFTGMTLYGGKWIYVVEGKYDTSYTGMAKNSAGWWYINKGNLDRTYTGMAKNAYGWWYMKNGKLDRTYTGLSTNPYGTWYMKEGKLDTSFSGKIVFEGKTYTIEKGKVTN